MFGVGYPHIKPESLKIVAIAAVPSVNREAALGLRRGDKENEKRDVVRTMRFGDRSGTCCALPSLGDQGDQTKASLRR
jgi:hypothetical protein